ncbi:hypothetical protein HDU97_004123, partial [Phlyctochytrium planicorne]
MPAPVTSTPENENAVAGNASSSRTPPAASPTPPPKDTHTASSSTGSIPFLSRSSSMRTKQRSSSNLPGGEEGSSGSLASKFKNFTSAIFKRSAKDEGKEEVPEEPTQKGKASPVPVVVPPQDPAAPPATAPPPTLNLPPHVLMHNIPPQNFHNVLSNPGLLSKLDALASDGEAAAPNPPAGSGGSAQSSTILPPHVLTQNIPPQSFHNVMTIPGMLDKVEGLAAEETQAVASSREAGPSILPPHVLTKNVPPQSFQSVLNNPGMLGKIEALAAEEEAAAAPAASTSEISNAGSSILQPHVLTQNIPPQSFHNVTTIPGMLDKIEGLAAEPSTDNVPPPPPASDKIPAPPTDKSAPATSGSGDKDKEVPKPTNATDATPSSKPPTTDDSDDVPPTPPPHSPPTAIASTLIPDVNLNRSWSGNPQLTTTKPNTASIPDAKPSAPPPPPSSQLAPSAPVSSSAATTAKPRSESGNASTLASPPAPSGQRTSIFGKGNLLARRTSRNKGRTSSRDDTVPAAVGTNSPSFRLGGPVVAEPGSLNEKTSLAPVDARAESNGGSPMLLATKPLPSPHTLSNTDYPAPVEQALQVPVDASSTNSGSMEKKKRGLFGRGKLSSEPVSPTPPTAAIAAAAAAAAAATTAGEGDKAKGAFGWFKKGGKEKEKEKEKPGPAGVVQQSGAAMTADQAAAAAAVASMLAGTSSPMSPPSSTQATHLLNHSNLQNPQQEEAEGLVFCTDLLNSVTRSGKDGVPMVVLACISFLDVHGLQTEGLYRIPGSHKRVKDWQEKFEAAAAQSVPGPPGTGEVTPWKIWSGLATVEDSGTVGTVENAAEVGSVVKDDKALAESYRQIMAILTSPEASPRVRWGPLPPSTVAPVAVVFEGEGSATVASVLKRFLIRIKGGLVGGLGFWEKIEEEINDSSSPHPLPLRIRRTLMERLPTSVHLATLAHIFGHLHRVSRCSNDNKMTGQNLAISLFPQGIAGAAYLIDHYLEIFLGQ